MGKSISAITNRFSNACIILGIVLLMPYPSPSSAQGQTTPAKSPALTSKVFASAKQAVDSLLQALKNNDEERLVEIFGKEFRDVISPTDLVAATANRKKVYEAAKEILYVRKDDEKTRVLVIGREAWPMPIPLIKQAKGWRFNTPEGVEEIINRRIGKNELSAIEVLNAYVGAQKQFASRDRDNDGVYEYAQKIKSSEGKQDGLYWEAKAGEEVSPFGPLVAEESDYLEDRSPGDPFKGYYFKILTRQTEDAPGGRYDYVINGNMIAGFSMIAFPADYGISGIMTFVVNQNGVVYEKDLGPETTNIGRSMYAYTQDKTWKKLTDQ